MPTLIHSCNSQIEKQEKEEQIVQGAIGSHRKLKPQTRKSQQSAESTSEELEVRH
jgi:hypothetical protein